MTPLSPHAQTPISLVREGVARPSAALELGARELQSVAAMLNEGVLWLCDGRIAWVNERLLDMAGCASAPGALIGAPLSELFRDTGDGVPDARHPRAVACAIERRDGQKRLAACRPVSGSALAGELWLVEDTTHVRQLESELQRATRELARVTSELASLRERFGNELAERDQLLQIVSHELRTPVTFISGYNRLLLAEEVGPLTPQQRRFLEESSKGCERLSRFIGNLMEACRARDAGFALVLVDAPVAPVLEEVAALFRNLADERGTTLEVRVPDPARCRARFDRLRVEQVLTNLIQNALDYTPRGGTVELIAERLVEPSGRGFVEIAVCDEGPGVAGSDRDRIFEPYVRAGDRSRAGGLGLGLAICKRIAEAHGGQIGVSERQGGGARFAFTLPAVAAEES
jgi:signal transduction histidine kinase